jgi:hypothetical protein
VPGDCRLQFVRFLAELEAGTYGACVAQAAIFPNGVQRT